MAIFVAMIALWLAYNLFDTTRLGVRTGMGQSDIYQAAYQSEVRLRQDFTLAIGPKNTPDEAAGALIVIPALRSGLLPVQGNKSPGALIPKLRSDQLVIFYDGKRGGLVRDTGTGEMLRSLTLSGARSLQAKIWYGHVRRAGGESESAVDWTFGRQATLLVDPDSAVVNTPAVLDAAGVLSPASPLSKVSDLAPHSLEEVANWMRAPGRTNDQMIAAFAVAPNNKEAYTNQPEVEVQPLRDDALDPADVFGGHRAFLNKCSEVVVQYTQDANFDGLADTDGADDFYGQVRWYPDDKDVFDFTRPGHAAAMQPKVFYPSDDQVRVWHLGFYQGPDISKYARNRRGDFTPYPAIGGLQFGDAIPNDPTDANPADGIPDNPLGLYNRAMDAYAKKHGWRPSRSIPKAQSLWPQLVRIRLRLHDAYGQVVSSNDDFTVNRRDDDGDGRLDNAGESRSSGVWFEYIFSIPYPRTN